MQNVVVTAATQQQAVAQFPSGVSFGGIMLSLANPDNSLVDPSVTCASAPYHATFPSVPPGNYVAWAVAVDSNGAYLGSPTSAPVVVPDPEVPPNMVDIPVSLSFSIN
jgi:hypothetical protein